MRRHCKAPDLFDLNYYQPPHQLRQTAASVSKRNRNRTYLLNPKEPPALHFSPTDPCLSNHPQSGPATILTLQTTLWPLP